MSRKTSKPRRATKSARPVKPAPLRDRPRNRKSAPALSDVRGEIAVVLLLISPAVIIPDGLNRFVFGKLLIAAIGLMIACLSRPTGALPRKAQILLSAGGVTLLAAAGFAQSPAAALAGRAERYEGVLTIATYLLAGVCGARLFGPRRDARRERLAIDTLAVLAGAIAVLAVLESAGLRPLSTNLGRPGGLLGNASDEGALAVLLLAVLSYVAVTRAPSQLRWRAGAGAVAAGATVVLSASRGALLGAVVALLAAAVLAAKRHRVPLVAAVLGLSGLSMLVPFTRRRLLDETPLAQHTLDGRHQLWSETVSLLLRHPILGVGPSNFQTAIVVEHDRRWQSTVGPANAPESPHDWILQTVSAGGVVLLAIVLALVVLLARQVLPALRRGDTWACATTCALVGYGSTLLFHLTSPGTTVLAAVLAGSLLAAEPVPTPRWRPAHLLGAPLAAALALLFLLASIAEIDLHRATTDVAQGRLAAADRGFTDARDLRWWDVDLPAQALHEFATVAATTGSSTAISYGRKWAARTGPVSEDDQVVLDRASLLEAGGSYQSAVVLLDRQLGRDHDNPLLLLRLGVLYAEQRHWRVAEADFRLVCAISPASPEPWTDLAQLYTQTGRPDLAALARRHAARLGG